ncbi:DNA replication/repair protein RecF [bacterium SCSIO 12741]|nr:DNA replication/repair protein RecF [bacterium SCSIO 12741]
MILKNLSLVNFKNYEEAELSLNDNVNCFIGNNGQGKTNLLDAIYYLAFCKSFFNPVDSQNIKIDQDFFVIQGTFEKKGKESKVFCGIKKGQKKQFKRNKKEYEKLADHIGEIPLVMVSPSDSQLISEGSEVRRRFMDGVIAQFDHLYLDRLLNYQRALTQRNSLLKSFYENRFFDADALQIWDEKLQELGAPIHETRESFLQEFIPCFQRFYSLISGDRESINLEYSTGMKDHSLLELLQLSLDKDRQMRYTTQGIHKEDLTFTLADRPLKKMGSQGQQKTYLVALKLAQFEFIRQKKGTMPLLLLDDIFDKLDANRVEALVKLVSGNDFGQIFITDTELGRMEPILKRIGKPFQLLQVEKGQIKDYEREKSI